MIRIRDSIKIPGRVRVTWVLLILNVLAFMAQTNSPPNVVNLGGMIPAHFFAPELIADLLSNRPPALVTVFWSMFLHGGLFHLFSNMILLIILGPNVEAQMGRLRFTFFYFACGCAGALLQALIQMESIRPVIGASGALSGLLGAYLVLFSDHYIRLTLGPYPRQYRDYMIPIKVVLALWIFSQFTTLLFEGVRDIAIFSHLGGFAAGIFLAGSAGVFDKKRRFRVVQGDERGPFGGTHD